ncbi:glycoside hydrolase family 65 protein [Trinickia sp. EG282A]|uniref:glycoside hydrolase family 65 protein n=1 Tax=Trinickia sp. EG282A TaxID=3237013 RepID=UPI0034D2150A
MSEQGVRFSRYDRADERRRESLLGLGNGMLFVRASAPEAGLLSLLAEDGTVAAQPGAREYAARHYAGTYRAGVYNELENKIDAQSTPVRMSFMPRLPDATPLAVRPRGGQWLSPDFAKVLEYRHELDLEHALAYRTLVLSAGGRTTRIVETRLVSAAHPYFVLVRWQVVPLDWSGTLEIGAGIEGRVRNTNVKRHAAYVGQHVAGIECEACGDDRLLLTARLSGSSVEIAVATRLEIETAGARSSAERRVEHAAEAIAEMHEASVEAGRTLTIDKLIAVQTSRDHTVMGVSNAALATLEHVADVDALIDAHQRAWHADWSRCRIVADDRDLTHQLDIRFFHLLQALSPFAALQDAGIPARGWQEAYHGHIFWDEIFAAPIFAVRQPETAKTPLLYRFRRLDAARQMAREAGLTGAMFPWRSATTGYEETPPYQMNLVSGQWMRDETRLERHVGAAICWNVWTYFCATGDWAFLSRYGAPLVVEIARFWSSLASFDDTRKRYTIGGVVGPDEYHDGYPWRDTPGLDDNAYVNVMAVWSLLCALEVLARLPAGRRDALCVTLALTNDELARWEDIARRMFVPFTHENVIAQFEGFDRLLPYEQAIEARQADTRLDWALDARGDSTNRYQVAKQPDVLMLNYLLGDDTLQALLQRLGYAFDDDAARRTVGYYIDRMTHESTLSRISCAGALARIDSDRSWQYFVDALRVDVDPQAGSSPQEGLHLGAFAAVLDVLQRRYVGLDFDFDAIRIFPALPRALPPLHFSFLYRCDRFSIETSARNCIIASDGANRAAVRVRSPAGDETISPGGSLTIESRHAR